jgi:hypothetical protein
MHAPRRRSLLVLTVLALAPTATATPAHATVLASGKVTVTLVTGGFRTCANGSADGTLAVARQWDWRVDGARSDGTLIAPPSQGGSGLTFVSNPCITVLTGTAPEGHFFSTLTYGGVGADAALVLVGTGTWSPETGPQVSGMSRP